MIVFLKRGDKCIYPIVVYSLKKPITDEIRIDN